MAYSYTILNSDATSHLQFQHFLEEYEEFECYGLAENTEEGLNLILKHTPNIVFINLDHNTSDCFSMVMEMHQYINELPIVIGISKTKEHAYEAIKNNFFDYWLLPFGELDIRKSLTKLKKSLPASSVSDTLVLKSYSDFQYIDTKEILYLQADNNATDFIMKDGSTISAFKTLKSFEDQLPQSFVRIHQSFIINTAYISRINYGKNICALKFGKKQLPFSKSYKENVDSLKKILAKGNLSTLN